MRLRCDDSPFAYKSIREFVSVRVFRFFLFIIFLSSFVLSFCFSATVRLLFRKVAARVLQASKADVGEAFGVLLLAAYLRKRKRLSGIVQLGYMVAYIF